ncbi:hypothetical protein H2201_007889 [Coniosporium apollinis]|uniref:C2H2-type domain-containing protein n=1 Tax=Coniosporium apollinis TaxID=61459 RepID=A0ABQ9NM24_9PEZI|nr:hypothetical protein H2201_007889 [Coniosporium apollinis]
MEAFVYDPERRVLICAECGFCLPPKRDLWKRHLRNQPHQIFGQQLKSLIELFSTYRLLAPDKVQHPGKETVQAIDGLKQHDGFRCYLCSEGLTRSLKTVKDHVSQVHGRKPAKQNRPIPLWAQCKLQTFFAETQHVRYFVVEEGASELADSRSATTLAKEEEEFFRQQDEDLKQTERDAAEEANKVHGFGSHKSAVVPWLRRTGIAEHIQDLKKDEVRASIALPKDSDQEPELVAMLEGMEAILREAHSWCFDGPDCMLTWPRQVVLNRFQSSKVELLGKTRAFDPDKEASTLATYFGLWKQLLAYMYRVVDPLKKALEALCIRLIYHNVGGKRYSSPLVSFCAMLSVKPSTSGWMRPGDYSSHLSGLIWVVQLLVFHHSAGQELKGLGDTLKSIKRICEKFLQQTAESPVGELLRWRLLLLKISKDDVGAHQARWDEDEQILTYDDTELRMDEVPKLMLLEYEQACELLYGELIFGA